MPLNPRPSSSGEGRERLAKHKKEGDSLPDASRGDKLTLGDACRREGDYEIPGGMAQRAEGKASAKALRWEAAWTILRRVGS